MLFKPHARPFDPSGRQLQNLIINEYRPLGADHDYIFVPSHGPFYSDSLVITQGSTVLKRGVDYQILILHPKATQVTGQEVAVVVKIDRQWLTGVHLSYQCVGGHYTDLTDIIKTFKSSLGDQLLKPIYYQQIGNVPDRFPSAPHLHSVWQYDGWEILINHLDQIYQALIAKSKDRYQQLFDYLGNQTATFTQWANVQLSQLATKQRSLESIVYPPVGYCVLSADKTYTSSGVWNPLTVNGVIYATNDDQVIGTTQYLSSTIVYPPFDNLLMNHNSQYVLSDDEEWIFLDNEFELGILTNPLDTEPTKLADHYLGELYYDDETNIYIDNQNEDAEFGLSDFDDGYIVTDDNETLILSFDWVPRVKVLLADDDAGFIMTEDGNWFDMGVELEGWSQTLWVDDSVGYILTEDGDWCINIDSEVYWDQTIEYQKLFVNTYPTQSVVVHSKVQAALQKSIVITTDQFKLTDLTENETTYMFDEASAPIVLEHDPETYVDLGALGVDRTATFTIKTIGYAPGTPLRYTLTGIGVQNVNIPLAGQVLISDQGLANLSVSLTEQGPSTLTNNLGLIIEDERSLMDARFNIAYEIQNNAVVLPEVELEPPLDLTLTVKRVGLERMVLNAPNRSNSLTTAFKSLIETTTGLIQDEQYLIMGQDRQTTQNTYAPWVDEPVTSSSTFIHPYWYVRESRVLTDGVHATLSTASGHILDQQLLPRIAPLGQVQTFEMTLGNKAVGQIDLINNFVVEQTIDRLSGFGLLVIVPHDGSEVLAVVEASATGKNKTALSVRGDGYWKWSGDVKPYWQLGVDLLAPLEPIYTKDYSLDNPMECTIYQLDYFPIDLRGSWSLEKSVYDLHYPRPRVSDFDGVGFDDFTRFSYRFSDHTNYLNIAASKQPTEVIRCIAVGTCFAATNDLGEIKLWTT